MPETLQDRVSILLESAHEAAEFEAVREPVQKPTDDERYQAAILEGRLLEIQSALSLENTPQLLVHLERAIECIADDLVAVWKEHLKIAKDNDKQMQQSYYESDRQVWEVMGTLEKLGVPDMDHYDDGSERLMRTKRTPWVTKMSRNKAH